jgi:hypothetical protein
MKRGKMLRNWTLLNRLPNAKRSNQQYRHRRPGWWCRWSRGRGAARCSGSRSCSRCFDRRCTWSWYWCRNWQ